MLRQRGVVAGERVAVLSRNRAEYLEVFLAASWVGAIVACQNWRLAPPELTWCLDLVEPSLIVVSPDLAQAVADRSEARLTLGPSYEALLASATPQVQPDELDPESPLLILYTSGTTGRPKGAVISHRAEIARNLITRAEYHIDATDHYVAWSPLYHMGGAEYSLGTLMSGGAVHVVDGFDADRLAELVGTTPLGWLLLMPGMVGRFADLIEERDIEPAGIKICGVMADLVPGEQIARITRLLDAPYANTFGATETGNPPASAGRLAIGQAPTSFDKTQSLGCEVRLVDDHDHEVDDGQPGELALRGPTLFSGYWRNPAANDETFRGGWFHMGDVFVRQPDGRLRFVDRSKYMIKSGGENIYPAEIERVLLDDPRVADAAVVKQADATWGEVPVAFVARTDERLSADDLLVRCREHLAGYKKPKAIHFIAFESFPRSASGKIQRHELERRLREECP